MNNKKKTEPNKSHAIRNLWIIFGSLVLLVILFFIGVATGVFGTMPTFEELENPRTNLATEIYSADGKILGTYYVGYLLCGKPQQRTLCRALALHA